METRVQSEAAAAAKSLQSCPTLCHPRDGSPSGSPGPGGLPESWRDVLSAEASRKRQQWISRKGHERRRNKRVLYRVLNLLREFF